MGGIVLGERHGERLTGYLVRMSSANLTEVNPSQSLKLGFFIGLLAVSGKWYEDVEMI